MAAPFFALASLLLCSGEDLDTWFHMAVGRWIVAHHKAPAVDVFSFTRAGKPYIDSHWLFQVALYAIHSAGGLPLMLAAQAACFLGAFWLAYRSVRSTLPEATSALLLLTAPVVADRILMRPDMATFLFLGVFWYALYSDETRPRWTLWLLPLAQAAWTNMHGLFPFGVALTGSAVAFSIGGHLLPALRERERRSLGPVEMGILGLAVLAACVATPYGFGGLKYAFLLYREIGSGADVFMKNVSELKAPSTVYQLSPVVVLYHVIAGSALVSAALNWRKVRPSAVVALLAFYHLATHSIRNTAYFSFLAAPFAAQNFAAWWGERNVPVRPRRAAQAALCLVSLSFAWYVATDRYYVTTADTKRFGWSWNPFLSVNGAADFVESENLQGHYINDILFGGFLIWRWPQRPVFTDGRLEVYGPEFLADYKRLGEAPETAWDELVRKYDVEYAVTSAMSPYSERLVEYLTKRPDWPLIYADGFAAVYAKRSGVNVAAIAAILRRRGPAVLADAKPVEPGLPIPGRIRYPIDRLARAKFALLAGDPASAEKEYVSTLEENPQLDDARLNLGALYFRTGRMSEAIAEFEAVYHQRPNTPKVLSDLGTAYLVAGRPADGIPLLKRAVELQPDLASAHASLGTALYSAGSIEEAATEYRKALEVDPNDAVVHFNLGACEMKLGRRDEATTEWSRALTLKPDYSEARAALSGLNVPIGPPKR